MFQDLMLQPSAQCFIRPRWAAAGHVADPTAHALMLYPAAWQKLLVIVPWNKISSLIREFWKWWDISKCSLHMCKQRYIALIARKVRSLCFFDDFLNEMRSSCDANSSHRCFIQALNASFSCYLKSALPPSTRPQYCVL